MFIHQPDKLDSRRRFVVIQGCAVPGGAIQDELNVCSVPYHGSGRMENFGVGFRWFFLWQSAGGRFLGAYILYAYM